MGVYENARNATRSKIIAVFWEMYREKPIEKITIRALTEACKIGRGTFYNHFQDVYDVLDSIEAQLSFSLNKMCEDVRDTELSLDSLSRILYDYYGDETERDYINVLILEHRDPFFAQDYLETLRLLLMDMCVEDIDKVSSAKERMIVDGAVASIVNLLLNCICKSTLTLDEINELMIGFMQNGFYITLTSRFGIKVLKNPFQFNRK